MASTNAPTQVNTPTTYPGKGLGIAGFIVSLVFSFIGLILSIIAFVQSRKAGFKNPFALAGIIIGSAFTLFFAIFITFAVIGFGALSEQCKDLGPGVHQIDSTTKVTCGSNGGASISTGSSYQSDL